MICQNLVAKKYGGIHRDPRCSLECRNNWAELESALLVEQLRRVVLSHNIYFGNIQIEADLTWAGHVFVRRKFLALLRDWKKTNNCNAEFRAVSEIGPRIANRVHYHYCVYADRHLVHATMRQLWERACHPFPIILHHDNPKKSIEAASKYMVKDLKRVRERRTWVWLFEYGTIQISWQSRGFFSPNKDSVLNSIKQRWKGTP